MENVILITVDCLRDDRSDLLMRELNKNLTRKWNLISLPEVYSNAPFTSCSFPSMFTSSFPLEADPYGFEGNPHKVYEVLTREGFFTAGFNSNMLQYMADMRKVGN